MSRQINDRQRGAPKEPDFPAVEDGRGVVQPAANGACEKVGASNLLSNIAFNRAKGKVKRAEVVGCKSSGLKSDAMIITRRQAER